MEGNGFSMGKRNESTESTISCRCILKAHYSPHVPSKKNKSEKYPLLTFLVLYYRWLYHNKIEKDYIYTKEMVARWISTILINNSSNAFLYIYIKTYDMN